MTKCNSKKLSFHPLNRRKVEADFSGGHITSDAGLLLLRQVDKKLALTERIATTLDDPRRQASCRHNVLSMLRQRVYGIAAGYQDQNDHNTLRDDIALQTAVESDQVLASQSTLNRWENRADRKLAFEMNDEFVSQFIASQKGEPEELILDFDATDVPVHGDQDGKFFNGYYHNYCFLPLYVTCGDHLLVAYLRRSKNDGAKHAWAILKLLVKRLRAEWPHVKIIFRGDCGFCRWPMFSWCERNDVGYIVGIARNKRLERCARILVDKARARFEQSEEKSRLFSRFSYAALSWDRERNVIVKAEHNALGPNTRFVITNLDGDAQTLYDKVYCARGNMENRIKEQQLDLFADRTSAHDWWPNQLRLLLSACAYLLINAIRSHALVGTELGNATCGTIRLKLIKIGAVITRNTRRILLKLSDVYPYKELFSLVAWRLGAT